jgi:HPt (histidine-containing phosphotransfer) domain-containing protein
LRVLRKFSFIESDQRQYDENVQKEDDQLQIIDFEFIKDKFGKDPDTFKYILEVFVEEIGDEIEAVRDHLVSANTHAAVRLVHKLVSTFTAMGMPDTAFNVSLIERMLKQNEDLHLVVGKWDAVERDYEFAKNQVIPVLTSLPV